MTGDQLGNLAYIGLMLAVIGGYFFLNNRLSMNKTLQYAAIWGLIFIGGIAAFGLWEDIKRGTPSQTVFTDQGQIEVPRSSDGHYYLTISVNAVPIRFVVDTGATDIVMSHSDAEKIGLDLDNLTYFGRAMTANGEVRTAPVRLDSLSVGPIVDRNMSAWVNEGEMSTSLLGMAYLQRFDRIEISGGQLILTR
jgi:aspartyl protease family protein